MIQAAAEEKWMSLRLILAGLSEWIPASAGMTGFSWLAQAVFYRATMSAPTLKAVTALFALRKAFVHYVNIFSVAVNPIAPLSCNFMYYSRFSQ